MGAGLTLHEVPYDEDGRLALEGIPDGACALIVQQPNALGVLEDLTGLKDRLGGVPHRACEPDPPRRDRAAGLVRGGRGGGGGTASWEPAFIRGPLLGFFATRMAHLRRMPGRVSGQTRDVDGKTGYVMTFQTREQHIRREGATSNICTNSALCALAATVYLAAMGQEGLKRVALLSFERAHGLAARIARVPGYRLAFAGPFFHEFVVRCADPAGAVAKLRRAGIAVLPPRVLAPLGIEDGFLVAVTEKRTAEELDRFMSALEGK